MPAVSQAQREWAFAVKGPAWARRHHFDNPGKLPPSVRGSRHNPGGMATARSSRFIDSARGAGLKAWANQHKGDTDANGARARALLGISSATDGNPSAPKATSSTSPAAANTPKPAAPPAESTTAAPTDKPVESLRSAIAALEGYLASEPEGIDKQSASDAIASLKTLLGKDVKEGEK